MRIVGKIFTDKEFDEFQIESREIGKGGFGSVHKATHPKHGTVAIKKVKVKASDKRRMQRVVDEIDCLVKANHNHVVQFFGSYQDSSYVYIVMEYCEYDSLRKFIKSTGAFDPRDAVHVLKLLLTAVGHLHKENIIHRDLSAGNILISKVSEGQQLKKPFIKICDFGLARELDKWDHARTVCGTPGYMAPEVLKGDKYDQYADVYSLGMVLYLMLTGEDPPEDLDFSQIKDPNAIKLLREMTAPAERRIKLVRISQTEFVKANSAFESQNMERMNSSSQRRRSKSREINELARYPSGSRPQPPMQSEANLRDFNNMEPRRCSRDSGRDNLESLVGDRRYADPVRRYRTASQPPPAVHTPASRESGIESAGIRYASSNPSCGGVTGLQSATRSSAAQKGWPIIIDRITLKEFRQSQKGLAYFWDSNVTFYPETDKDLSDYRFDVKVLPECQTITIFKSSAPVPLDALRPGQPPQGRYTLHGKIHSLQDFPPNSSLRTMYYNLVNLVNYVRSKQTKIQLRGPGMLSDLPGTFAELMESGDVKVFPDENNSSVRCHFSTVKRKWDLFPKGGNSNAINKIVELDSIRDKLSRLSMFLERFPVLVTYYGYFKDIRRMDFVPLQASDNIRGSTLGNGANSAPDNKLRVLNSNIAMEKTPDEMPRENRRPMTGAYSDNTKGTVYKRTENVYAQHDPRNPDVHRPSTSDKNTNSAAHDNKLRVLNYNNGMKSTPDERPRESRRPMTGAYSDNTKETVYKRTENVYAHHDPRNPAVHRPSTSDENTNSSAHDNKLRVINYKNAMDNTPDERPRESRRPMTGAYSDNTKGTVYNRTENVYAHHDPQNPAVHRRSASKKYSDSSAHVRR